MTYDVVRCMNHRSCSIASAGRNLLLRSEDRSVCPQCGSQLSSAPAPRRNHARVVVLGGLFATGFILINVAAFGVGRFFVAHGVAAVETAWHSSRSSIGTHLAISDRADPTITHTKMNRVPG